MRLNLCLLLASKRTTMVVLAVGCWLSMVVLAIGCWLSIVVVVDVVTSGVLSPVGWLSSCLLLVVLIFCRTVFMLLITMFQQHPASCASRLLFQKKKRDQKHKMFWKHFLWSKTNKTFWQNLNSFFLSKYFKSHDTLSESLQKEKKHKTRQVLLFHSSCQRHLYFLFSSHVHTYLIYSTPYDLDTFTFYTSTHYLFVILHTT